MENESPTNNTINTINPNKMNVSESCELIWRALKKASLKGAFDIDESYVIKIAYSNIKNKINSISQKI